MFRAGTKRMSSFVFQPLPPFFIFHKTQERSEIASKIRKVLKQFWWIYIEKHLFSDQK